MSKKNLNCVSIDLHQLAQRRTGPLTRVLIGDAQPNRWLVGPRRTVPYIEEVGTAAQVTRFAAATIPTIQTLTRSKGKRCCDWKRHQRRTIAVDHATVLAGRHHHRHCNFYIARRCLCAAFITERGHAGVVDGNSSDRYVSQ